MTRRAYFNKDKYFHWIVEHPDYIEDVDYSVTAVPKHWSHKYDGRDITYYSTVANSAEVARFPNITEVFVMHRYKENEVGYIGSVIIHPDWVDWRESNEI